MDISRKYKKINFEQIEKRNENDIKKRNKRIFNFL